MYFKNYNYNIKMKHRITSEDIACLVPALNSILDGAYLTQIYDGMKDSTKIIIMKLRNRIEDKNINYYLLIESGIRTQEKVTNQDLRQSHIALRRIGYEPDKNQTRVGKSRFRLWRKTQTTHS